MVSLLSFDMAAATQILAPQHKSLHFLNDDNKSSNIFTHYTFGFSVLFLIDRRHSKLIDVIYMYVHTYIRRLCPFKFIEGIHLYNVYICAYVHQK